MKRLLILVLAPLVLFVAARFADKSKRVVAGDLAQKRSAELTSAIAWKHSLDECLAAAKADGKLVFWVQMLGDLDGYT